ncbi:GNAT family N-acetyltransferase [Paenibacillus sp. MWE-103]|uniref:GNAT family N-acetyltransferase n=1 Tax=Paenibacillus artemisiicola TaxID=1172618 RepID=A0ABS3WJN1_9BACL|nr:GNAT family N-acetyltransferase [Paenibacillus artemisiicola]MBO7748529.1 GNAT family N-acetyltransferase [Paenibacillus artemisiicola]
MRTATIRRATEQDLKRVEGLSGRWVSEGITHGLAVTTEAVLRGYLGDYFWVAALDSAIVGYILGSVRESEGLAVIEQGETYLEIDEVYVLPEYRSMNAGHGLVDRLLQASEENGVRRAVVYSASKQWQRVVGFYEKHGFQMWFVQMYR